MKDKDNNDYDIVVIGAGFAGLTFAATMAQEGRRVAVLESHSLIGGCASYFKRKGFHFEVGATTLSGLAPGRTLWRLCKLLDLELPTNPLQIPMAITLNNKQVIKRHRDHSSFIKELNRVFPGHQHDFLWNKLRKWERDLWKSLFAAQNFPPKSFKDIRKLIRPSVLNKAHLGPLAFIPLVDKFSREMQEDQLLTEFFDEQLMISTQSSSKEVPTLLASMGMTYPEDMHYIYGGVTTFAQILRKKIESLGSEVHTRHKVITIEKQNSGFRLTCSRGSKETHLKAKIVVSSTPIWNTADLFADKEVKKKFLVKKESQKKGLSAVVANIAIKYREPIEILYHQVHYQNHSVLGKGSFFFSFSHPHDQKRAPEGHQAITVSTHTAPEVWQEAHDSGTYEELKSRVLADILERFKERFGAEHEIVFASLATPHTFEHYTQRFKGRVGGLSHNRENNILTFPSQETPIKNFYRIGDTTFPGQGIVGVATGALILAGKLSGKNFLE